MKKIFQYSFFLSKRILNYFFFDNILNNRNLKNINTICKGNEILIFILHCEKYKDRVSYIKEYYSKFISVDFVFYSDYEDIGNNVLKVSYSSDYSSNEIKHINILNLIKDSGIYEKYKLIFFVDDDTFINMNKFVSICTKFQNEINDKYWMCGQMLCKENNNDNPVFKKHPRLQYLSGGAGYLMKSNLFNYIPKFKMHFTNYADFTLGLNLLNYSNIKLHDSKMFHSQKYEYYNINRADLKEYVTFHYVKSKEDFEFYRNCCTISSIY